jgi:hypothetical protein
MRWRRWLAAVALVALVLVLVLADRVLATSLRNSAFATGWLLVGFTAALAGYGVRKRVPVIPIGAASTWLTLHTFGGIFALGIYVIHVKGRLPSGPFEIALAAVFTCAGLSGVLGLMLSRILPPRLATRGEEVLHERIPRFREEIRRRVEALVERSVVETGSDTIAGFYLDRLAAFFARPRNATAHLLQSQRPLKRLLEETAALERYLNAAERSIFAEIVAAIRTKDDLDYQYAMQGVLKLWLLVHVPLTGALLVLVPFHVVLVYAFRGGLT